METNCYNICKKLSKEECDKNERCKYTNGLKRKYCRLRHNKMDEKCNRKHTQKVKKTGTIRLTKKQKERGLMIKEKMEQAEAREAEAREAEAREAEAREAEAREAEAREAETRRAKLSAEKKTKARKIIGRFMNKTKHRRKAMFLRAVCLDSGVCLAFGTYANEIKKHFGGFANFEYATAPIKRIGSPSANGFINEIQYDHRGYKSYAVLKSSMKPNSDNLMYEYMVGQYINKLNKRFPCFVETYGYYIYDNTMKVNTKGVWTFLQDSKITANMDTIKKGLILQKTTDYAKACKQSKFLAILIQHLKGILPIKDRFRSPRFVAYELANVLFQVYMPLGIFGDSFTHYDLHHENVNVYEPEKDSYIHFHYHMDGGEEYSFKSKYIAKIIDYGRSYFKDEETGIDSKKIYTDLCKEAKCNPSCGYSKGFSWMYNQPNPSSSYWISSQKRNKSHDLRLLNEVKVGTKANKTGEWLSDGLKSVLQKLKYDKHYGTPEMTKGFPNTIQNVYDAAMALGNIISLPEQIQQNEDVYRGKTKLGDLHIYCGKDDTRPMRFVKA